MPAASELLFTETTNAEPLVVPLPVFSESQLPPLVVEAEAVNEIFAGPVLVTLRFCEGGFGPPDEVLKLREGGRSQPW